MIAACNQSVDRQPSSETVDDTEALAKIPESLAPFGDGYPDPGSPCRSLGESAATSRYLDDSAQLIGCPSDASADALDGTVVGNIEGVRLVSIPTEEANPGAAEYPDADGPDTDGSGANGNEAIVAEYASTDVLVPGTRFHATTILSCGFAGAPPTQSCEAGVIRNRGEDGKALVEVTKPDGTKRSIFFDGITPTGTDDAEAGESAGWGFRTTRSRDQVTIEYGPETYIIVDALIIGG